MILNIDIKIGGHLYLNICSNMSTTEPCFGNYMWIRMDKMHNFLKYYKIGMISNRTATKSLQWRNNERDGVSHHQPHHCLLNRLFRRRWKKTSKRHVTCLCAGNSLVIGEFPAQMTSNAENVSIWWRHHDIILGIDFRTNNSRCSIHLR